MDENLITIRVADAGDEGSLQRLAERDSSRVPAGQLLLAVRDARVIAAVAVESGAAIADPFTSTEAALELLRVRIRQLRSGGRRRPRRRLRGQLRGALPVRLS